MAGLLKFWEHSQSTPFVWGQCDCVLWMAQYIEAKTGRHPATDVIGSYDRAFGARRIIMQAGGLLSLVSRYMGDFEAGSEVGIFKVGNTKLCGVSGPNGAAFKTEAGLMITKQAVLIKGWNI